MLKTFKRISTVIFLFVAGMLIFLSGIILLRPRTDITANVISSDTHIISGTQRDATNTTTIQDTSQDSFMVGNWKLKNEHDKINFLLLGRGGENHQSGELIDIIMVASFSPLENKLKLLSIPRDLYVKMPERNYYTRINAIKPKKDLEGKSGITFLKETIKQITGVNIHYYTSFDFSSFKDLIDNLGGIAALLRFRIS